MRKLLGRIPPVGNPITLKASDEIPEFPGSLKTYFVNSGTAALAAASLGISVLFPGVISLVIFATLVSPAAVFIPFILSVFWKRTPVDAGFWAILAAAAAGCSSQIFWYGELDWWLGRIDPLFVAPIAAAIVMFAGLWVGGSRDAKVDS